MKCINHNIEFVKRIKENGGRLLNKQCLSCGEKDSKAYKLNSVSNFDSLPNYNDDLHEYYQGRKSIISQNDYKRKREQERLYWLENVHNKYINSDKWKSKRIKVLNRDKWLCQACLKNKAESVHHLTYANFEDEPLFDLISVCNPCHEKIHKK